jgi:hypothetical protein
MQALGGFSIGQQLILRFLPMGVDIGVFLCYDKTVQKKARLFPCKRMMK